jgi:predicted oxidoreductase (fatty acid repression mutant protein)
VHYKRADGSTAEECAVITTAAAGAIRMYEDDQNVASFYQQQNPSWAHWFTIVSPDDNQFHELHVPRGTLKLLEN